MTKRAPPGAKRRSRRGPLATYRKKRDFARTAEPAGGPVRSRDASAGRFVIHKHAASRLHYDLRLELGGTLKSWAVPKGPSAKPGEKRLAVQVEDHPLEYGSFEGTIPAGEYGGGTVMVWDRGAWTPLSPDPERALEKGKLEFRLDGEKLAGTWTLVRMGGAAGEGGKNWLWIKKRDESRAERASRLSDESVASGRSMDEIARGAATPSRKARAASGRPAPIPRARKAPLPRDPRPQLATLARAVPDSKDFVHEIKFDGYRILARVAKKRVTLVSRNGKDWTRRFPGVAASLAAIVDGSALIDGEIVALDREGVSSFQGLQRALSDGATDSLVYQAFDLLHLDGFDWTPVPLLERKRALESLLGGAAPRGRVRFTEHFDGAGEAFWGEACRLRLEGIVSKRKDAPYRMGVRSPDWLKVKCVKHEDLVIGGFTDPGGSREGFGALLLGAYAANGKLVYAGKVGTGFDRKRLRSLALDLGKLEVERSPFSDFPNGRSRSNGVHWVRPERVAEVEFTEWTRDGLVRHPSFRGIREDKAPSEVKLSRIERDAAIENGADPPPPAKRSAAKRRTRGEVIAAPRVAGVPITHPDRVLFPELKFSKFDLARYYESVADWILPAIAGRPLALVRCPEGRAGACFFQKHPGRTLDASIPRVEIREKSGAGTYVYVKTIADVVSLVQTGTLEFHVWGSRVPDVERPDQLVFDLDPGPDVAPAALVGVARRLRERLAARGFESFPRTTGGKGFHVVVPLAPAAGWDAAKAFARDVCADLERDDPKRLTTNMSKAKRAGRVFLDYLRNGRGATAIASYSTRAREGAPVATPLRWEEFVPSLRSDRFTAADVGRRLRALKADPWAGFDEARRPLRGAGAEEPKSERKRK